MFTGLFSLNVRRRFSILRGPFPDAKISFSSKTFTFYELHKTVSIKYVSSLLIMFVSTNIHSHSNVTFVSTFKTIRKIYAFLSRSFYDSFSDVDYLELRGLVSLALEVVHRITLSSVEVCGAWQELFGSRAKLHQIKIIYCTSESLWYYAII